MYHRSAASTTDVPPHAEVAYNLHHLQVENWPIDRLIPRATNPRIHSTVQIAQITASIQEWGWTNPILVGTDDDVIAGHARLLAARQLGMTEVPVIPLRHLSAAQRRALVIADNQLALNSGWDEELLRIELAMLQEADYDLSLLGWDDEELARLLAEQDKTDGFTDEDNAPEPQPDPVTQAGDLWILGRHRLLAGDATDSSAVQKLMDGYLADLVAIDPPYNVSYTGKTKDALTIQNDTMDDAGFFQFLLAVHKNIFAVTKPGAGIYVFHADTEGINFRRAMKEAGFKLAQCCVWVKQTLVMGRQDYHWQHEPVLYGWKPGEAHRWYADRKQTTVWRFDRPSRSAEHPTMKPVALVEYPLFNSSRGGDVVLDTFGGSGTTLIACEKNGRSARLMELDPVYCDVIVKRWQEFTGKQAVLESDGRSFAGVAEERVGVKA